MGRWEMSERQVNDRWGHRCRKATMNKMVYICLNTFTYVYIYLLYMYILVYIRLYMFIPSIYMVILCNVGDGLLLGLAH